MDTKYTEQEESLRKYWKNVSAFAQGELIKINGEAAEREKRERDAKATAAAVAAKRQADKLAAERAIKDRGLVDAFIEKLGELEKHYGMKPVSWSAETIKTNGQMSLTVQFSPIGEPRTFSPRW